MHPRDIAKWISEDIEEGGKGVIAETLYGIRVEPGNSPIDKLINSVDANFLDFDQSSEGFQAAVVRILGAYPNENQWVRLINSSSQKQELKAKILHSLGIGSERVPTEKIASSGKYSVELVNGNVIDCDFVKQGKTNRGVPILWIGIGPTTTGFNSTTKKYKHHLSELFAIPGDQIPGLHRHYHHKWKFAKIMTVKQDNIVKLNRNN